MKVTTEQRSIQSNAQGSTDGFTIKASSKAFSILSDKLYSDKVKAVIREVSCNAYDSHVAAGKAHVPIEIHLPNSFEPWFSVRDFGVGLNHLEVTTILTKFFESTKADSNDFTGCLGLGSKAPFAYVDSFSIIAIKDGVKRCYTAYKGEDGSPCITLMEETATDEANGVEVSVPVKQQDCYSFAEKAASVYKHFKVFPNINDESVKDLLDKSKESYVEELSGDDYSYYNDRYDGKTQAIMGNVAYPIDVNFLSDKLKHALKNTFYGASLNVEFAIGELDIAPSREALSYDKKTVDNLENKLLRIIDTLIEKASQEKILPSKWEARLYIQHIRDFIQCNYLCDYMVKSIYYQHKKQKHWINPNSHQIEIMDKHPMLRNAFTKFNSDIVPAVRTVFLYDDTELKRTKLDKLVKFALDRHQDLYKKDVLYFSPKGVEGKHSFRWLKQYYGFPPFLKVSKILEELGVGEELVTEAPKARSEKYYILSDNGLAYQDPSAVDFARCLVCLMKNGKPQFNDSDISTGVARDYADIAKIVFGKPIIFIPFSYKKKLPSSVEYLEDKFKAAADSLMADEVELTKNLLRREYVNSLNNFDSIKSYITDTSIKEFLELKKQANTIGYGKCDGYFRILRIFNLTSDERYVKVEKSVEDTIQSINKKYRLIDNLDESYIRNLSAGNLQKLITFSETL